MRSVWRIKNVDLHPYLVIKSSNDRIKFLSEKIENMNINYSIKFEAVCILASEYIDTGRDQIAKELIVKHLPIILANNSYLYYSGRLCKLLGVIHGLSFSVDEGFDEGLKIFKEALEILESIHDKDSFVEIEIGKVCHYIATFLRKEEKIQYDKVYFFVKRALDLYQKHYNHSKDDLLFLHRTIINFSEACQDFGKLNESTISVMKYFKNFGFSPENEKIIPTNRCYQKDRNKLLSKWVRKRIYQIKRKMPGYMS